MAEDDQLQHDLELLAGEIKQWQKRWQDPMLLLRRAYQLLSNEFKIYPSSSPPPASSDPRR